jgi:hypothetical protein
VIIESAQRIKDDGSPMSGSVGVKIVTLRIAANITRQVGETVRGFAMKDKVGRTLFGDNRFWRRETSDVTVADASRWSQKVLVWQRDIGLLIGGSNFLHRSGLISPPTAASYCTVFNDDFLWRLRRPIC